MPTATKTALFDTKNYFFLFSRSCCYFEMATEEKNLNEEMDFDLTKKKKKKSKGLSLEAEKELELAGEDLRKSKRTKFITWLLKGSRLPYYRG